MKYWYRKLSRQVSPRNFPFILVPISDSTVKPVIAYRQLKHTIPNRLPLPVITDILRQTENKLFSAIDTKAALWKIELEDDSKDMTLLFSTPTGHYRFKRMPLGLSIRPLTYMGLMNTVLHGLIAITASVFLHIWYINYITDSSIKLQETRINIFQISICRFECESSRNVISCKTK